MSVPELWMPLHITRYLVDTKDLDLAQHGAYLLLLMQYWQKGPLPDDDTKLCRIIGVDIRIWRKVLAPALRPFFTEHDGKLHQKRADIELAKAADISSKRRAAAFSSHRSPPTGGGVVNGHDHGANAPANAEAIVCPTAHAIDGAKACAHASHTVPFTKKESITNLLTFKEKPRANAREEVAGLAEKSGATPEPAADAAAVAFERGKVVGKLRHIEYAPGAYQQPASVYKTAAENFHKPRPKAHPLVGEALQAARRTAGYSR
jgi:hypothetical protein